MLQTRHHARCTPSGKLDILSFSWEKHAFVDRASESETLWAPKNWHEKGLGKQDLVEKSLQNNLYYFDMRTLPAFAAVDHPAGSVQATAVLGAGRWGDISVFGEDCTGGLKLGAVIPSRHACQYAADVVKRMMILDPATKVTSILIASGLLIYFQHFLSCARNILPAPGVTGSRCA